MLIQEQRHYTIFGVGFEMRESNVTVLTSLRLIFLFVPVSRGWPPSATISHPDPLLKSMLQITR